MTQTNGMTVEQAREVLAEFDREIKSVAKRKAIAGKLATNPTGRLPADVIAVYREYAAA